MCAIDLQFIHTILLPIYLQFVILFTFSLICLFTGSEAAAATALFGFRSARPLFHTHFLANHPFMFLIYDEKTDMILFFGVYQDPKA